MKGGWYHIRYKRKKYTTINKTTYITIRIRGGGWGERKWQLAAPILGFTSAFFIIVPLLPGVSTKILRRRGSTFEKHNNQPMRNRGR